MLHTVEGIYSRKLKRPQIFTNKVLASYPVLRKGQQHIPKSATKLSALKAISSDIS